jgi:hypothetical protein
MSEARALRAVYISGLCRWSGDDARTGICQRRVIICNISKCAEMMALVASDNKRWVLREHRPYVACAGNIWDASLTVWRISWRSVASAPINLSAEAIIGRNYSAYLLYDASAMCFQSCFRTVRRLAGKELTYFSKPSNSISSIRHLN